MKKHCLVILDSISIPKVLVGRPKKYLGYQSILPGTHKTQTNKRNKPRKPTNKDRSFLIMNIDLADAH